MILGRERVVRLCCIFLVSGLLVVMSVARAFSNSMATDHLLQSVIMVLVVVLLCLLIELCWKPFSSVHSLNSSGRRSDSTSSSNRGPQVYGEHPPSYDEMLAQGQLQRPPSLEFEEEQEDEVSRRSSSSLNKPDISTMLEMQYQHTSPRYSPFFTDTQHTYTNNSELQLTVDRLPSYDEAVAMLFAETNRGLQETATGVLQQSGTTVQQERDTTHSDDTVLFM